MAAAPMAAPCNSCGSGAVNYDSNMMYEQAPTMTPMSPTMAPAISVPESTEGSVIVPTADGASHSPIVNPNAFVIQSK
jgi:hypothetical protein